MWLQRIALGVAALSTAVATGAGVHTCTTDGDHTSTPLSQVSSEQQQQASKYKRRTRRVHYEPLLTEAPFPSDDAHRAEAKRNRKTERFVFEALVGGLPTTDGANVVVYRYLGGNESISVGSSTSLSAASSTRGKTNDGNGEENAPNNKAHYITPLGEFSEWLDPHPPLRRMLDPFLVFDAYRSVGDSKNNQNKSRGGATDDDRRSHHDGAVTQNSNNGSNEYSGGFPAHPHMGMLEIRHFSVGGLRHTDSCGRDRYTPPGGGQALFAGRGIIHEEKAVAMAPVASGRKSPTCGGMKPEEGSACQGKEMNIVGGSGNDKCETLLLDLTCASGENHNDVASSPPHAAEEGFKGFQLWLNVPKAFKSQPPNYRSVASFPTIDITRAYPRRRRAPAGSGRRYKYVPSNAWVMYEFEEEEEVEAEDECTDKEEGEGTEAEDQRTAAGACASSGDHIQIRRRKRRDPLRYPSPHPSSIRVIAGRYNGLFGPFTDMIRGGAAEENMERDDAENERREKISQWMGKSTTKSNQKQQSQKGDASSIEDPPSPTPSRFPPITKETVKGFLYLDVTLRCDHPPLTLDVPSGQNTLMYMYDSRRATASSSSSFVATKKEPSVSGMVVGSIRSGNAAYVPAKTLAVLGDGDHVVVSCPARSSEAPASADEEQEISFILVTAPPVGERVFIANGFALASEAELGDAMRAFESGEKTWC